MHTVGPFDSLDEPDPRNAANLILNALKSDKVVTVNGACTVDYDGRAASDDPAQGFFVVMLKPDGTALVHSNEKFKPMNWQPSGAEIQPEINKDNELEITAESDEFLQITFSQIFNVSVLAAEGRDELDLIGTEEDLHEKLMDSPELIEEGFTVKRHEKEFPFGRVDLFGEDKSENDVIVEVKRRSITRDHIYQLSTYLMDYEEEFGESPRGILVAPSATEYMEDIMEKHDIEFSSVNPL